MVVAEIPKNCNEINVWLLLFLEKNAMILKLYGCLNVWLPEL